MEVRTSIWVLPVKGGMLCLSSGRELEVAEICPLWKVCPRRGTPPCFPREPMYWSVFCWNRPLWKFQGFTTKSPSCIRFTAPLSSDPCLFTPGPRLKERPAFGMWFDGERASQIGRDHWKLLLGHSLDHVHSHSTGQSKSHGQVWQYIPCTGITLGRNLFHSRASLLGVMWQRVWMYNTLLGTRKMVTNNNALSYTKKWACAGTTEDLTSPPSITGSPPAGLMGGGSNIPDFWIEQRQSLSCRQTIFQWQKQTVPES